MPEPVRIRINGITVSVAPQTTVAAAIVGSGISGFRRSVTGELRGPVCGMGICFECRVTINGQAQIRACQVLCRDAMEVQTDA